MFFGAGLDETSKSLLADFLSLRERFTRSVQAYYPHKDKVFIALGDEGLTGTEGRRVSIRNATNGVQNIEFPQTSNERQTPTYRLAAFG
jgi:hypothetical protein